MKITCTKKGLLKYITIGLVAIVSEYLIPNQTQYQKIVWMCYAVLGIYFAIKSNNIIYKKLIMFICIAPISVFIYTAIIRLFCNDGLYVITQAFTTSSFIIVDILMAFSLFYLFKEDVVDVIFYSIILSYLIGIVIVISKLGIMGTVNDFVGSINGLNSQIERNDIGTSVVILILFYMWDFFENKKKRFTQLVKIIVLIIMCVLCGKRSALIGLFVGIFATFLGRLLISRKLKLTNGIIRCLTIIVVFAMFIYIISIKSGTLNDFANSLGINSMGRLYVWSWFNGLYSIIPTYMGRGFQFIHIYMQNFSLDGMVHDFGYLHNSILQLYIELGFVGFISYFYYNLCYITKKLNGLIGNRSGLFYFCIYISTIAIYTTDNVLTYPVYQLTLYACLFGFVKKFERGCEKIS